MADPDSPKVEFGALTNIKTVDTITDRSQLFHHEVASPDAPKQKDYRSQGRATFYDQTHTKLRGNLKHNFEIRQGIHRFWKTFGLEKKGRDYITRNEFEDVEVKLCKALFWPAEFNLAEAKLAVSQDWKDAEGENGDKMTEFEFVDSLFETVDIWTNSVELPDYVDFLQKLYDRVAVYLNGQFQWREMDDIMHMDSKEPEDCLATAAEDNEASTTDAMNVSSSVEQASEHHIIDVQNAIGGGQEPSVGPAPGSFHGASGGRHQQRMTLHARHRATMMRQGENSRMNAGLPQYDPLKWKAKSSGYGQSSGKKQGTIIEEDEDEEEDEDDGMVYYDKEGEDKGKLKWKKAAHLLMGGDEWDGVHPKWQPSFVGIVHESKLKMQRFPLRKVQIKEPAPPLVISTPTNATRKYSGGTPTPRHGSTPKIGSPRTATPRVIPRKNSGTPRNGTPRKFSGGTGFSQVAHADDTHISEFEPTLVDDSANTHTTHVPQAAFSRAPDSFWSESDPSSQLNTDPVTGMRIIVGKMQVPEKKTTSVPAPSRADAIVIEHRIDDTETYTSHDRVLDNEQYHTTVRDHVKDDTYAHPQNGSYTASIPNEQTYSKPVFRNEDIVRDHSDAKSHSVGASSAVEYGDSDCLHNEKLIPKRAEPLTTSAISIHTIGCGDNEENVTKDEKLSGMPINIQSNTVLPSITKDSSQSAVEAQAESTSNIDVAIRAITPPRLIETFRENDLPDDPNDPEFVRMNGQFVRTFGEWKYSKDILHSEPSELATTLSVLTNQAGRNISLGGNPYGNPYAEEDFNDPYNYKEKGHFGSSIYKVSGGQGTDIWDGIEKEAPQWRDRIRKRKQRTSGGSDIKPHPPPLPRAGAQPNSYPFPPPSSGSERSASEAIISHKPQPPQSSFRTDDHFQSILYPAARVLNSASSLRGRPGQTRATHLAHTTSAPPLSGNESSNMKLGSNRGLRSMRTLGSLESGGGSLVETSRTHASIDAAGFSHSSLFDDSSTLQSAHGGLPTSFGGFVNPLETISSGSMENRVGSASITSMAYRQAGDIGAKNKVSLGVGISLLNHHKSREPSRSIDPCDLTLTRTLSSKSSLGVRMPHIHVVSQRSNRAQGNASASQKLRQIQQQYGVGETTTAGQILTGKLLPGRDILAPSIASTLSVGEARWKKTQQHQFYHQNKSHLQQGGDFYTENTLLRQKRTLGTQRFASMSARIIPHGGGGIGRGIVHPETARPVTTASGQRSDPGLLHKGGIVTRASGAYTQASGFSKHGVALLRASTSSSTSRSKTADWAPRLRTNRNPYKRVVGQRLY